MTVGTKVDLDAFIAEVEARAPQAMTSALEELYGTADHLLRHLGRHADLAAQIDQLCQILPMTLAHADEATRGAAAREALHVVDDLRDKWIAADNPPLVDEIDDHLAILRTGLEKLHRPGPARLREIAHRIDTLAEPGHRLEGVERAYLPWAVGAGFLFIVGIVWILIPAWIGVDSIWPVLLCLLALPAVGAHYAWRVMPRSQADAEIETLNRVHFLPLGGIYFPASDSAAGVIPVEWTPPPLPDPKAIKDPRAERKKDRGTYW